jgi:hypothetical protein
MNEQEFAQLAQQGAVIDAGEAAHAEAAASGMLDARGNIMTPDPDARAMEWLIIPQMAAMVAKAIYPEVASMYTDERCLEVARAFVPVADKYGWTGSQIGPEVGLIMAGVGFAAPAYMAHRARKALAAKADQENKAGQGGDGS